MATIVIFSSILYIVPKIKTKADNFGHFHSEQAEKYMLYADNISQSYPYVKNLGQLTQSDVVYFI